MPGLPAGYRRDHGTPIRSSLRYATAWDIGVSPAALQPVSVGIGERDPVLGRGCLGWAYGDHAGTNQVSGHAEKSRFPARQPAPVRQARARVCAISDCVLGNLQPAAQFSVGHPEVFSYLSKP